MDRKGCCFLTVKKASSPESKKSSKSKKKWGFGKSKQPDPSSLERAAPPPIPTEETKLTQAENEQNKHAYSVAIATAAAAEAAIAAAEAAAEVVRLTAGAPYSGKPREEAAAIKIQTAFRGYLARRALRALRGLVRLKSLIQGNAGKRQATTTLRCMQTLVRVQSQIRTRRMRMAEENQALQRQLLQKREKELEHLKASMGDDWDDSIQSKEQVEANLLSKHEAAIRRERALAYAYSHQTGKSSRSANPMFMDPNNLQWGWSWLERWTAARPWENGTATGKELNDTRSLKSVSHSVGGEISKAYARRDLNTERPSPVAQKSSRPGSRQSPSTPPSKATSVAGKSKLVSPRSGLGREDDSRSITSLQSERPRRHSIAGSSVRDDESLASSSAIPSYMVPTESARAKARLQSPLGDKKHKTPEKVSAGSAKKRLSFQGSPAGPRRHSDPPRMDTSLKSDIANPVPDAVSNGGSM